MFSSKLTWLLCTNNNMIWLCYCMLCFTRRDVNDSQNLFSTHHTIDWLIHPFSYLPTFNLHGMVSTTVFRPMHAIWFWFSWKPEFDALSELIDRRSSHNFLLASTLTPRQRRILTKMLISFSPIAILVAASCDKSKYNASTIVTPLVSG